jgi:hypothetical protein
VSDDWRPYEPSLEAERSAVYERAARKTLVLEIVDHNPKSREWFERVFGAIAHGGER